MEYPPKQEIEKVLKAVVECVESARFPCNDNEINEVKNNFTVNWVNACIETGFNRFLQEDVAHTQEQFHQAFTILNMMGK